jgi:hypothetical protein
MIQPIEWFFRHRLQQSNRMRLVALMTSHQLSAGNFRLKLLKIDHRLHTFLDTASALTQKKALI